MNNTRRKQIKEAIDKIWEARDILENVKSEEEDAMDSMPENLQGSERYSDMETAVSDLEEAMDNLESAISLVEDI